MDNENKKSNQLLKTIVSRLLTVAVVALLVVLYISFAGDKTNNQPPYESKIDVSKYVEATEKLEGAIDDHRLVAKNDSYELYLKEDTLSIKIKDLKTGEVMDSTIAEPVGTNDVWTGYLKSGVVLTLIKGIDSGIQADFVNSKASIDVTDLVNGFKAEVDFEDYGVMFTMYVTLEDNDICVAIPNDTIVEYGGTYLVNTISVYPTLGATYLGEEAGYMFIPDGSGALISLEDKEGRYSSGYSKYVYGTDAGFRDKQTVELLMGEINMVNDGENILAPIYGMVHTDRKMGFLAIIEEGDPRAIIEAIPNGAYTAYNRIYSKFVFNTIYTEYTSQDTTGSFNRSETRRTQMDISVRFSMVSGDEATYSGLALEYREYLLDNDMIKADLDTSYNTRVDFLGAERENWLTTTTPVTMTTIDNIREIYDELKDANVTDILTVYKGWQDGGIQDVPIEDYKVDGSIGGTKKLTKLVNELKDTDIKFYLYQEAVKVNPKETNATFNVIKKNDKKLYEETVYMDVYRTFNYLTPQRTSAILKSISSDYKKDGIENIALAGISNKLFSYYYSGMYYSRQQTADNYESAISKADEKLNVMLEQPFAYLWKYTDAFLDMPVASSNYMYESEQVPFLSIALKGIVPMYSEYVNFEANKQQFFLKLVETGIFPSFYITYEDSAALIYTNSADIYSSKYSVYKQDIIDYAGTLSAFNAKVEGALITNHEILDSGAVIVTYDNGVKVYINYTNKELVIDGVTVGAMEFMIGGEGNE